MLSIVRDKKRGLKRGRESFIGSTPYHLHARSLAILQVQKKPTDEDLSSMKPFALQEQQDSCATATKLPKAATNRCRHRLDDRRLSVPTTSPTPIHPLILFRINDMEARRTTDRQQLYVGTDNGQTQGLQFQRQRQM